MYQLALLIIIVGFFFQTLDADLASTCPALIVNTTEGAVQGIEANGCRVFYNIPYASPPIGRLRFAPPESPKHFNGSFYDASFPSPKLCIQPAECSINAEGITEDCLHLNIYTPMESSATLHPVLVWIHGGAFFVGSKDQYNLTKYANSGEVVAVSINYRLGPFGFLRVDEKNPAVNGFLDQVQALKWIQANIANFGGDPDRITIAGESAGGTSVLLHLISPASRGLFHKIFASSLWLPIAPTMIDANITSTNFTMAANCMNTDLRSCIQNSTSKIIMEWYSKYKHRCAEFYMEKYGVYKQLSGNYNFPHYAYRDELSFLFYGFHPEVGNSVLTGQVIDSLKHHTTNSVSNIMIGVTWNDALLLPGGFGGVSLENAITPSLYKTNQIQLSKSNYIHVLNQVVDHTGYEDDMESYERLYTERAQKIYNMYPSDESNPGFMDMFPDGYNGYEADGPLDSTYVYLALANDKYWLCPTMSAISALLKKSVPPSVYMFRFKQPQQRWKLQYERLGNDPEIAVEKGLYSFNRYATHADDLALFSFMDINLYGINFTSDEEKLHIRMFSSFVDFLHTGNPNVGPMNASAGTKWEKFDPLKRNMIYLSEPQPSTPNVQNVRASQCQFWEDEMNFLFSEDMV